MLDDQPRITREQLAANIAHERYWQLIAPGLFSVGHPAYLILSHYVAPIWMESGRPCHVRPGVRKSAFFRSLYTRLATRYVPVTHLPSATGYDSSPRGQDAGYYGQIVVLQQIRLT